MIVFGQGGCVRAKWLYSGKSGCYRVNVVVLGRSGCICSKVAALGQNGCFRVKCGSIRAKVVVFWNVVVFKQKWLCSSKSGYIWAKVVVLR